MYGILRSRLQVLCMKNIYAFSIKKNRGITQKYLKQPQQNSSKELLQKANKQKQLKKNMELQRIRKLYQSLKCSPYEQLGTVEAKFCLLKKKCNNRQYNITNKKQYLFQLDRNLKQISQINFEDFRLNLYDPLDLDHSHQDVNVSYEISKYKRGLILLVLCHDKVNILCCVWLILILIFLEYQMNLWQFYNQQQENFSKDENNKNEEEKKIQSQ